MTTQSKFLEDWADYVRGLQRLKWNLPRPDHQKRLDKLSLQIMEMVHIASEERYARGIEDNVKSCPDCEKPNQFGEVCGRCQNDRETTAAEGRK